MSSDDGKRFSLAGSSKSPCANLQQTFRYFDSLDYSLAYTQQITSYSLDVEYDGTGRRIVKGVDENSDGSLDTFTHFFHNRDNQVLETRQGEDVSGAAPAAESLEPKSQNIWSPRYVDSLILRDECDAQGDIITANRLYYLNDANYNVTALVGATGDVVERYLYTPYGTVTVLNPDFSVDADGKSDYDNTTLYTGREFDPETELMYYRARYYHSELGRFVGRDPIGYYAGLSLLNYVGNRPVQMVDPAGLVPNWRYDYWGPTDTTAAVRPPSWERLPPITIEEPSPIYLPPPERLPPVNIGPPPQQPFPPITVPPQFPGVGQLETPSLNLYPPGKCLSPFESLIQDLIHNYWPRYTDPPEESGESQASLPLLDPGDPGHPNLPGGGGLITFPVLGGQGSIGIDVQPGQRNPLPGHIQIEWPIRRK